jgi:hypothetical protein
MQLIYRGTTYSYTSANVNARRSAQRICESAYEVIYRGSTYRVDPTVAAPTSVKPSQYELIYRGETYQVTRNKQGEVTAIASFANSSKRNTSTNPAIHNVVSEHSIEM